MSEIKTLNGYSFVDETAREAANTNATAIDSLSEEIAKHGKPFVYIDGVIPTTKDYVLAELTYEHGAERWHAYIKIKCQGSSSMNYAKKNFTVELFKDEARTIPFHVTFDIFGQPSNKFVLKANWVDHTHARNIVAARIWGEVVGSRDDYDTLPEQMRNSPNNGAINGFPIIVYTNGSYQGLYTWNIGKDAMMWGMDENDPNQALICGRYNSLNMAESETATNFRKLWDGTENHWEYEIGENREGIVESFNRVISCVKDTSEVECKAQLDNYLDVQSAIDYDIVNCVFMGVDNTARNMLAQTYNLVLWRLGMYDLDSTFGTGSGTLTPDKEHLGPSYYEQNSLLWERIEKIYPDRLKQRGRELRKGVLSYANIMSHFEEFIGSIGKEAYEDDLIPYPDIPVGDKEPIWQFRNWVRDRLAYFDGWLEGLVEYVLCTSLTLDKTTLTFTSAAPQTLTATVLPANCNDVVKWTSSDTSIAIVENGVVTPVSNGNVTITASCSGVNATCNVAITGLTIEDTPLFNLAAPVTFESTNDVINPGFSLLDEDKSFTILVDFTVDDIDGVDPQPQLLFDTSGSSNVLARGFGISGSSYSNNVILYNYKAEEYKSTPLINQFYDGNRFSIALRRTAGSNDVNATVRFNGNTTNTTATTFINDMIFDGSETMLTIGGARWYRGSEGFAEPKYAWPGTLHRAKIYDRYLSDDEVTEFVNAMDEN